MLDNSNQKIIEKYKQHIRKPAKNQVVRLDNEHFEYIEIIRAIYGNEFVTPNTAEIIKTVLKHYVTTQLNKNDVDLALKALSQVIVEKNEE